MNGLDELLAEQAEKVGLKELPQEIRDCVTALYNFSKSYQKSEMSGELNDERLLGIIREMLARIIANSGVFRSIDDLITAVQFEIETIEIHHGIGEF